MHPGWLQPAQPTPWPHMPPRLQPHVHAGCNQPYAYICICMRQARLGRRVWGADRDARGKGGGGKGGGGKGGKGGKGGGSVAERPTLTLTLALALALALTLTPTPTPTLTLTKACA